MVGIKKVAMIAIELVHKMGNRIGRMGKEVPLLNWLKNSMVYANKAAQMAFKVPICLVFISAFDGAELGVAFGILLPARVRT